MFLGIIFPETKSGLRLMLYPRHQRPDLGLKLLEQVLYLSYTWSYLYQTCMGCASYYAYIADSVKWLPWVIDFDVVKGHLLLKVEPAPKILTSFSIQNLLLKIHNSRLYFWSYLFLNLAMHEYVFCMLKEVKVFRADALWWPYLRYYWSYLY